MKWKITPMRAAADEPAGDAPDVAAARWSERLREAGAAPALRRTFEAWQARSPEHAAAFRRVEAAHALVAALAQAPQMQALRRETLARAAGRRAGGGRRLTFAVAASLLLVLGLGLVAVRPQAYRQFYSDVGDAIAGNVYRTDIGQRSAVTLEDGTVMTLNTDSRVSIDYSPGLRSVRLERGQALFKVARNPVRPFVVSAGGRQVTALGTEFDVLLSDRAFEVTLLEGRVRVTRAPTPAAPRAALAELRPGQQYVAVAKAPPRVRTADVERVVSWRHGQLMFDDERLEDAVAEMNRYSRRKIVLGDADLASLKISGAFNTGDTATFVSALTDYFPIERAPQRGDDGADAIVLKSRAAGTGRLSRG